MNRKILIVDDEAHIRLLLEQTLEDLEEEGVTVLTAADGEEGLEAIRAERPSLVLLDVMMPRINGFDVCHTVKREMKLDEVTVVLLTAKGQEYDKLRGDEVGADLYLTKPFDPDAILELAQRILNL
jgi:DNA-binding response OmpR family regulator